MTDQQPKSIYFLLGYEKGWATVEERATALDAKAKEAFAEITGFEYTDDYAGSREWDEAVERAARCPACNGYGLVSDMDPFGGEKTYPCSECKASGERA